MLDSELSLSDIFRSSGNALRVIPIEDFTLLSEEIKAGTIVAERCAVEPTHGGLMERLQNQPRDSLLNDARVWHQHHELKIIANSGGSTHQALCFLAAAWLIDQGYSVSSEIWRNGKRVDIATECGTWLIECGDTNPGAVVNHLQRAYIQVMILPFQLDWHEKPEGIVFKRGASTATITPAIPAIEPIFSEDSAKPHPVTHEMQQNFSPPIEKFSKNTIRAHLHDLKTFSTFLADTCNISVDAEILQTSMENWQSIDLEIVQGFLEWMLKQGYAIGTANRKLSTVKNYAKLANQARVISVEEALLIRNVKGYSQKEGKRIDACRETTRVGEKKAEHVSLPPEQARQLKRQPKRVDDVPAARSRAARGRSRGAAGEGL